MFKKTLALNSNAIMPKLLTNSKEKMLFLLVDQGDSASKTILHNGLTNVWPLEPNRSSSNPGFKSYEPCDSGQGSFSVK